MEKKHVEPYRSFLKDNVRQIVNFAVTDQSLGLAPPPIQKPVPAGGKRITLPGCEQFREHAKIDLCHAIHNRESRRSYSYKPLSLEELSFLLWATQGVRRQIDNGHALRNVPSAGCRHALETYLCVLNIQELEQGIYRYLPLDHELLYEFTEENLADKIVKSALGQPYPGGAAVTFIWSAVPYRMEWRYGIAAHKVIAIDAGHVCQNLYLACEAIGAGTCAIAAYDQHAMDSLIRVDGREEFVIYLAPVGKRP
jgi:SagB-type dehydrogenase family enzyme